MSKMGEYYFDLMEQGKLPDSCSYNDDPTADELLEEFKEAA